MKYGRSLQDLAKEIDRQNGTKKDYLVDTRATQIDTGSGVILLGEDGGISYKMTENFHKQLGTKLGIPAKYYDTMLKEAPDLLDSNVNYWFKEQPEKNMIRTMDDKARAFLSNKYRPLDNYDLLQTALPIVATEDSQIISCEVTESRMYLKVLFPKVQGEVTKGDIVQAGIVISNSEIGHGSLRVEPLIYRLVCTNGMITNSSMKKYHVGRHQDIIDVDFEILSDETRRVDDKAFWMKVRDVIKGSMNSDIFMGNLVALQESTLNRMTGRPDKAVLMIQKANQLTDRQGADIINHLINGGDLSQYGLANAITRTANDQDDYDEATRLERLGGKIIELQPIEWQRIAVAV